MVDELERLLRNPRKGAAQAERSVAARARPQHFVNIRKIAGGPAPKPCKHKLQAPGRTSRNSGMARRETRPAPELPHVIRDAAGAQKAPNDRTRLPKSFGLRRAL